MQDSRYICNEKTSFLSRINVSTDRSFTLSNGFTFRLQNDKKHTVSYVYMILIRVSSYHQQQTQRLF